MRGRQLLVVDDNPTVVELLTRQVRAWGMETLATTSGVEALRWIARGAPFDVALVDRRMPGLDGPTLAREIRKYPATRNLPIALLTTVLENQEQASGDGAAGMLPSSPSFFGYLAKPVKPVRLRDLLNRMLGETTRHAPQRAPPVQLREHSADAAPLRILVADDAHANRDLTVRVLARMGYHADAVANGQEVLDALGTGEYDVILMDVHMPQLDGLSAARRIREQRAPDSAPYMVAVTGSVGRDEIRECRAAGMNDFLIKPWELCELEDVMRRATEAVRTGSKTQADATRSSETERLAVSA
jgi:CheY-like chemotaxis protein